jgi:DNA-binding FadR family transcriptional regulator
MIKSNEPDQMKVVPPQHRQIFDALRKGNSDIASKLITKHLDDVITIWEAELKKNRSLNEQAERLRPSLCVEKEVSI